MWELFEIIKLVLASVHPQFFLGEEAKWEVLTLRLCNLCVILKIVP
jgi:hypothetical protein